VLAFLLFLSKIPVFPLPTTLRSVLLASLDPAQSAGGIAKPVRGRDIRPRERHPKFPTHRTHKICSLRFPNVECHVAVHRFRRSDRLFRLRTTQRFQSYPPHITGSVDYLLITQLPNIRTLWINGNAGALRWAGARTIFFRTDAKREEHEEVHRRHES